MEHLHSCKLFCHCMYCTLSLCSFFFVRALMFLSSLRPWIFWVICWAGLEVYKAILVECLSCTIQHHLNQKWWCKGLRVARSALKTVHSGQFDNPPPPPKKIYIYLATPPCLITAAQFHHELTPSYSFPCPCPPTYCSQWKTVDMISCHSKVQTSEPFNPWEWRASKFSFQYHLWVKH